MKQNQGMENTLGGFFPTLGMKNNPAYANGTLLSLLEVFFFLNQKLYLGFTVQEKKSPARR